MGQAQTDLRRRILRTFVGRGLLQSCDAKEMWPTNTAVSRWMPVCASKPTTALAWSVCCATAHRPPFSMERLRQAGSELVYRCAKQYSEHSRDKRGAKADELIRSPLGLIGRI